MKKIYIMGLLLLIAGLLTSCSTIVNKTETSNTPAVSTSIPTPSLQAVERPTSLDIKLTWEYGGSISQLDNFHVMYLRPGDGSSWSEIVVSPNLTYTITNILDKGFGTYRFKIYGQKKQGGSSALSQISDEKTYAYTGYLGAYSDMWQSIDSGSTSTHLSEPGGIAIAYNGEVFPDSTALQVYVADQGNNRILRLDGNGAWKYSYNLIRSTPTWNITSPKAVAISHSGTRLYVVDRESNGQSRIIRFNVASFSTNPLKWSIAEFQTYSSGYFTGAEDSVFECDAITVQDDNTIYISDDNNHRIFKIVFDANGVITGMTAFTSSYFTDVSAMAYYSNYLYILNRSGDSAKNRVLKLNTQTSAVEILIEDAFNNATGMALDSDSATPLLYIADTGSTNTNLQKTYGYGHRILVYDTAGTYVNKWGTYGTDTGEFIRPAPLAFYQGTLYVVEKGDATNYARIQRFFNNKGVK